jgi:CheY-like chemotaxis protein
VRTILVADDEAYIRMLMEEALEELAEDHGPIRILFAKNGRETLETARKEKPDLVYLDIMMPEMDGHEVCRTLKTDPDTESTFVVILTAKGQEEEVRKGLEAGADIYMTKPFNPMAVMLKTRELLDL